MASATAPIDGARCASLASDAAAAVGLVRHEARTLLASCATSSGSGLSPEETRLASALHAAQAICGALDVARQPPPARPHEDAIDQPSDSAWLAWRDLDVLRGHGVHAALAAPSASDGAPQSLQQCAEAAVPEELRSRNAPPLALRAREDGRSLELTLPGALRAIVDVHPVGDGSWAPTRVAVGPSHDPMPAGALEPPELLVFHDVSARAGALLAALEALAPADRLGPLLRWLCSLRSLFDAPCVFCDGIFPPGAASARELLPPTARGGAGLVPCHAGCFAARFGRSPEQAFVDACVEVQVAAAPVRRLGALD